MIASVLTIVNGLKSLKLSRLALSLLDRISERPQVVVLPRALDAPARERRNTIAVEKQAVGPWPGRVYRRPVRSRIRPLARTGIRRS